MANFECLDCNSTVRRSRVNSAVSHRRIAFEAGLKDHIFLQFLWILATGAPPGRPQKWIFFVILEPFHSTRFCSGNVSSNSGVAFFRTKILFFWTFCAPETANPLLDWGKKTRLAPVVESLVSNVQTTIFLSKISEKLPLSETPKCQLF